MQTFIFYEYKKGILEERKKRGNDIHIRDFRVIGFGTGGIVKSKSRYPTIKQSHYQFPQTLPITYIEV
jgi:hypothetical protein